MRLRLGRPAGLLVIAPHPDDEAIGAHALMTRLRRRGVAIRLVVVSDGAASHPASIVWPRARLVRERRRETRRMARGLGIAADAVVFLDLPDGALAAHRAAIRRGLARACARLPRPGIALAPSPLDDHPDHRAVATIAAAATRSAGLRRLAYPVWPVGQRLPHARSLPLTARERLAKTRALRGYHTQAGAITDDPGGFAMTRRQIAGFCGPREMFADRRP